jgi:drug/metabolite transporter (DMT)-like permease
MSVQSLNLLRLVLGTVLVMLAAVLVEGPGFAVFADRYVQGWLWLGLSGITALGIGDYFGLRMYTILSPRYGSVLTTLSPAMALLMGRLLLDERMNLTGIAGMAITITGVMTMSLGRKERSRIPDHGHGSIVKGIGFGIISALCNGAGLAMSKKGFMLQAAGGYPVPPLTGSFMRFLVATIAALLVLALVKKLRLNYANIKRQRPRILMVAATGVLFGPLLGVGFAMTAIQYIDVAVAQTIFALVPVVALLISHLVYKEKITGSALAGMLAAVTGVLLLVWRIKIAAFLGL